VREEELFKSYEYLGIPSDRVTVLDDPYVSSCRTNRMSLTDDQTPTRWNEQPLGFITCLPGTG